MGDIGVKVQFIHLFICHSVKIHSYILTPLKSIVLLGKHAFNLCIVIALSEDSDQPEHPHSLISLYCLHEITTRS